MKFTSLVLGAVLLTATACTQDELADGDRLPEGQYPSPGAHRRRASARTGTAKAARSMRATGSPCR